MGDLPLLGTNAQIIRIVEALFGVQPGNTYYTNFQDYVADTSLDSLSNALVGALAPADAESLAATVAANYQVDPALETDTGENVIALLETYITAQLNTVPEAEWGAKILEITNQYTNLWADPLLGESVTAFNDAVVASLVYSANPANPDVNDPDAPIDPEELVFELTTDRDTLTGSESADVFKAIVIDNFNTLQSGDSIDGGAGVDTLMVEVGSSQNFAITPDTNNLERFIIDARSDSVDSNDNNLRADFVQVDAGKMDGVIEYGTDGSRADVVIEDIRIRNSEITKDVTFSMRDTDPGSAAVNSGPNGQFVSNGSFTFTGTEGFDNDNAGDGSIANDTNAGASLHAYFDANSLRQATTSSAGVISLQVIDGENAPDGNPLQNTYNDTFAFYIGDINPDDNTENLFIITDPLIQSATTYAELLAGVESGIQNSLPETADQFTVSFGADFTLKNADGVSVTGQTIVIETTLPGEVTPAGWQASDNGITPPDTNVTYRILNEQPVSVTDLITSGVILDNVGRGSEGGDLELGTMSTRGGVERFDVKVEDSSWVTNMRSTNEALEYVEVVTSEVARDAYTRDGDISDGYLYIGSGMNGSNNLTGLRLDEVHLANNGLIDVRTFDASTFEGDLKLGATLSNLSIAKYLHPIEEEVLGSESADTVAFTYDLAMANNFLNLDIDASLAADSDFSLEINGGENDDDIMTDINNVSAADYLAQKTNANITINTGAGDDTVLTWGAGDIFINTGTGNDTIYVDNSGVDTTTTAVKEVQTLTINRDLVDPVDGQISVDGVLIDTLASDTGVEVAAKIVEAFANNQKFVSVTSFLNKVTFTFETTDDQELLELIDTDSTGIVSLEVQTVRFTGAIAAGDVEITVAGVGVVATFSVEAGDDAAAVAEKATAALNADLDARYTVVDNEDGSIGVTFTSLGNKGDILANSVTTNAFNSFALPINGTADTPAVAAVAAVAGTPEVQTLTFSGATFEGNIEVGGLLVPVAEGDVLGVVATSVDAAITTAGGVFDTNGILQAATTAVAGGVVTVTFTNPGDQDPISYLDIDNTGTSQSVATTTAGGDAKIASGSQVAIAGVHEVQTLIFQSPNNDGTITVDGVEVAVLGADTAEEVAAKVELAFNGVTKYSSVQVDAVNATSGYVVFTFAETGNQEPIEVLEHAGVAGGDIREIQTVTFSDAANNGVITLTSGELELAVTVAANDDAEAVAAKVAAVMNTVPGAVVVDNADGSVTFQFPTTADEADFVTAESDTGVTGTVTSPAVGLHEVQTIKFGAANAVGDTIIITAPASNSVNVAVAASATAATIATDTIAALNADAAFTLVATATTHPTDTSAVRVIYHAATDAAPITFDSAASGVTISVAETVKGNNVDVQTIAFTEATTDGFFAVGGVPVEMTAGDTAAEVAAAVEVAYHAAGLVGVGLTYSAVTVDATTPANVVFTFNATGEQDDIVIANNATGVTSTTVENLKGGETVTEQTGAATAIVETTQGSNANEVQTLTITSTANADGDITVDGVTVAVLETDTLNEIAVKVAAAVQAADDALDTPIYSDISVTNDDVAFTFAFVQDDLARDKLAITSDMGTTGTTVTIDETIKGGDTTLLPQNTNVTTDIEGLQGTGNRAVWTANNVFDNDTGESVNIIRDLATAQTPEFDGIKGQLVVDFKGLTSETIDIDYTGDTTSALQIRQALKDAVNNDAVLSKLLVVKDGPANTFVIESLIDGDMDVADLDIAFIEPLAVNATPVDGRLQLSGTEVAFDDAAAESAYEEVFAEDDTGLDLSGANSIAPSDNTINSGSGNDVTVLGTTADNGSFAIASSNDTVVFTDNFNTDTIVNFTTANALDLNGDSLYGEDYLDFTSYLTGDASEDYHSGNTLKDNDIIFGDHEDTYTTAANIAAKGVLLEVHADDANVMDVYTAVSAESSTSVSLSLVGTIDLADVAISSLTALDFI